MNARSSSLPILLMLGVLQSACRILPDELIDRRPVLRLRNGPVATLDPAQASDWNSLREIGRVYETPLRYHRQRDQGSESGATVLNLRELRPWLLERMPVMRAGGLVWVLEFRQDRRFHPSVLFSGRERRAGRTVSACDWVDSIRRHMAPSSSSPWRTYLSRRFKSPASIQCDSPARAVLRLSFPDPEFLFFLSHPASSVLPVREMQARGWDIPRRPVGSGAFGLAGPRSGAGSSVLHWRAMNPALGIKAIEVSQAADSSGDWEALRKGRLDAVELPEAERPNLLGADEELAAGWRGQGFALQKVVRSDVLMVAFSAKNRLLASKRGIRLALGQAVLPAEVSRQIFGGRAMTAHGPIPPGVEGYHLDYRHAFRGGDVDRARDLLGSNGFAFGKGLPILRLGCLDHPVERAICGALARSWARIGIRVEERILEASERREAILSGEIDLWLVTWVADLPGPASFLEVFWSADLPEVPAVLKDRPKFAVLLDRIRMAPRGMPKQRLADLAQDFVNLDGPAAFLLHRFQYWLVRDGVQGVGLEDFSWHDSDQVSISRKTENK